MPWDELFAQLALVAGAAIGMEYYARYAHKFLWHDKWWSMPLRMRKEWNRPIWLLHESHHLPREAGPGPHHPHHGLVSFICRL
jgi:beta-carotene 3-hydroxylase